MLDILAKNPYRIIGIYGNSTKKDILANFNKTKAFLKVGKDVTFPLDLPEYFADIKRTLELITNANAKLTLPKDQILYAQFWFVKMTPLDDIAFNHLIAGDITKAVEIWQKKECASSLQNCIISALMLNDYDRAIKCAETLYGNSDYINQFVSAIIGTGESFDITNLAFSFLDILCDEIGANKLLPFITNITWKNHIKEKAVKPLIESIQNAIDIAQKSKGKGYNVRLQAGKTLMSNTKGALAQLKSLVSPTDIQYQIIADKLGLEILQCGIDYYNGSDEPDAANKAMLLQNYAMSIVVGKMAKDRCKENVDILKKIIASLPPSEVFAEDKAIKDELSKFVSLPNKICHAVTLLNNTKPILNSIKSKLGNDNQYYLRISTLIVNNALSNIIEEVNIEQNRIDTLYKFHLLFSDTDLATLKKVTKEAWKATKLMDSFDKDAELKKRYEQNRGILKDLCKSLGISTSLFPKVDGDQIGCIIFICIFLLSLIISIINDLH